MSATLVGKSLAIVDLSQPHLHKLLCFCKAQGSATDGLHLCVECPQKYCSRFGRCPGFHHDGSRIPAAWSGDEITDATKKEWRDFIAVHNLQAAVSARGAEVNFG